MLQCCRRSFPDSRFVAGDWLSTDIDDKFDIISFISSLHHIEDWEAAIQKSMRSLRDGGVVYVEHEPTRFYAALFKQYAMRIKRCDPDVMGKVELHWFGKPSILPSRLPEGET